MYASLWVAKTRLLHKEVSRRNESDRRELKQELQTLLCKGNVGRP